MNIDSISTSIQTYDINSLSNTRRTSQTIKKNIMFVQRIYEKLIQEKSLITYINKLQNARNVLPVLSKLSILCNMFKMNSQIKKIQLYIIEIYSANLYLTQINPTGKFNASFYQKGIHSKINTPAIKQKIKASFFNDNLITKLEQLIDSYKKKHNQHAEFIQMNNTFRKNVKNPSSGERRVAGVLNKAASLFGLTKKPGVTGFKGQRNTGRKNMIIQSMNKKRNNLQKAKKANKINPNTFEKLMKDIKVQEDYLLSRAGYTKTNTGQVLPNTSFRNKINARRSQKNKLKSSEYFGTGNVGKADREMIRRQDEGKTLNQMKKKAKINRGTDSERLAAKVINKRGNTEQGRKQQRRWPSITKQQTPVLTRSMTSKKQTPVLTRSTNSKKLLKRSLSM